MRGTGQSNPLRCPAIEDHVRAEPEAPMFPPDLVADCARELAGTSDLSQYSTANAARDIDAVRAALGYERIDLNAASYGTTLALRYIQDFPDRVRSAVLVGAAPADKMPPAHHAVNAKRGLDLLFDACAADPDCARQYPDLRAELAKADPGFTPMSKDFVGMQVQGISANPQIPVHAGLARFLKEQKAWNDKWKVAK